MNPLMHPSFYRALADRLFAFAKPVTEDGGGQGR